MSSEDKGGDLTDDPSDENAGEDVYLTGQLLVAMPTMGDPRFERTVIYMCAHSADGAMGLVVNKEANEIDFPELLSQLEIETGDIKNPIPVLTGGPVETGRGFVLHSMDYSQDSTLKVTEDVGLTATVDILRAIAEGEGPAQSLLTLGYAGWSSGQLDNEIQANGWLNVSADASILFDEELGNKWDRAVRKVGIDPSFLSAEAGHA
ncbi:MAG: YqgE/AlgH family protein [Rhodospirillaceae bacterium]|jgi:putative transcriptional regulator|nr:YqgE/AlgH family protein [Rhodospirillaceae bacterium]MBT5191705.1 YqgE/AlgH family protein [Rhodospirillaceae bacterium]MBT5897944.1 YqgE/AlgH family protein [Rhodospirillaceae bacterium]MBT6430457.1 YqgE/AlgH family protein [Rhodospirillaceae bacterium]MBT7666497.1 YqgE/AlgH family protein [Rhodospirillaceae bacterium]